MVLNSFRNSVQTFDRTSSNQSHIGKVICKTLKHFVFFKIIFFLFKPSVSLKIFYCFFVIFNLKCEILIRGLNLSSSYMVERVQLRFLMYVAFFYYISTVH